jgi:predicted RNA-binding Zn-ribbon protein involved in translation (DUF1610 family)
METDLGARWHEEAEEVISGMKEWRLQHPKATFREIEQALDERLGKMRARLLCDAAMASAAAELASAERGERLRCPQCGAELEDRGVQERQLTTHYDQVVRLERHYGVCPACGAGFFPSG